MRRNGALFLQRRFNLRQPPSSGLSATFSPDFGGEGTWSSRSKLVSPFLPLALQRFYVARWQPSDMTVAGPDLEPVASLDKNLNTAALRGIKCHDCIKLIPVAGAEQQFVRDNDPIVLTARLS